MKLSYEFTPRILEHIASWGREINRNNPDGWTEYDSKIYFLLHTEIRKMRHKEYINQKNGEKKL
jgi:hypothetical protein